MSATGIASSVLLASTTSSRGHALGGDIVGWGALQLKVSTPCLLERESDEEERRRERKKSVVCLDRHLRSGKKSKTFWLHPHTPTSTNPREREREKQHHAAAPPRRVPLPRRARPLRRGLTLPCPGSRDDERPRHHSGGALRRGLRRSRQRRRRRRERRRPRGPAPLLLFVRAAVGQRLRLRLLCHRERRVLPVREGGLGGGEGQQTGAGDGGRLR